MFIKSWNPINDSVQSATAVAMTQSPDIFIRNDEYTLLQSNAL